MAEEKYKSPNRKEMDQLYKYFAGKVPRGAMLPMGKEGMKLIMRQLKKIRGLNKGGIVAKTKSKFKGHF